MEECTFCKIVRGELPSFKIYEDERTLAFPDVNPISGGHTLVVPKRHSENLYQIPMDDLTAVHYATQIVIHAIQKALNPIGVAVVQLNGRGVNQIIMHYHVHLIPRAAGSPPLVVSDMGGKQADMDSLKQTAQKISVAIK